MKLIVFSDLDGTILDDASSSMVGSLAGLAILKKRNADLVLASGKTFSEMRRIHGGLGLPTPFIFENGAGIARPDQETGGYITELAGISHEKICSRIDGRLKALPVKLKLMRDISAEEIALLTGLDLESSLLAKDRLASMPFVIQGDLDERQAIDLLRDSLDGSGLSVTKGGKFYHLVSDDVDKGLAASHVAELLQAGYYPEKIFTIAIGDNENDKNMLLNAMISVVVRRPDGSWLSGVPGAIYTEKIGPEGFSEGVARAMAEFDAKIIDKKTK
jgi:mannosyl-3-phosphoglycerate phosphatase